MDTVSQNTGPGGVVHIDSHPALAHGFAHANGLLPHTGANVLPLALLGFALMIAGFVLYQKADA